MKMWHGWVAVDTFNCMKMKYNNCGQAISSHTLLSLAYHKLRRDIMSATVRLSMMSAWIQCKLYCIYHLKQVHFTCCMHIWGGHFVAMWWENHGYSWFIVFSSFTWSCCALLPRAVAQVHVYCFFFSSYWSKNATDWRGATQWEGCLFLTIIHWI